MKKLILLIALFTTTAYASVYMHEGPNGEITYSDTPSKDAKKINVPTGNTITTKHYKEATKENESEGEAVPEVVDGSVPGRPSGEYKIFKIISPKNEETITNQPNIPVQMQIEPRLSPDDKVQVMLDDSPVGEPVSSSYQELGLVERGSHTVYATIIGPQKTILKQTDRITFYVQRTTRILSPTRN